MTYRLGIHGWIRGSFTVGLRRWTAFIYGLRSYSLPPGKFLTALHTVYMREDPFSLYRLHPAG